MTKGDAYKAYYEANKERILEANKERAKEKRNQLREASEEEKEKAREKQRAKIARQRLAHYTVAFDELATLHKDNEYGSIYQTLAKSKLEELTPTMFDWLCRIHSASNTDKNLRQ
jgi:hypothetical protein